ncbi:MAG TPA: AAA family ATPase, partial [Chloroflexota bacterium]
MLTLTGPPGDGKSRLAAEVGPTVAERFPDGVYIITFTSLRDPNLMMATIAQQFGILARNRHPVTVRLNEYLRKRTLLLILDNFDRMLPAAAQLSELLATCPGVALLVTCRGSLHLQWEQTERIAPLATPNMAALPPPDELAAVPAIALFVERARAINADFSLSSVNAPAIAALCVHLDGLPLAIELAAAGTLVLSPQMLLERWAQRLLLLHWDAPDLPEQQRTLRSAYAWSYDWLNPAEQALFRILGEFVGGFDLEAIVAVVAATVHVPVDVVEALTSLVDKSLIQLHQVGSEYFRYGLSESIQEFALERLAAENELASTGRAHAHHYLALVERADPQLRQPGQAAWFVRLEHELDNLRAAFRWLLDHGEPQDALRLAVALGYFWWIQGRGAEGWRWLEEALPFAPNADSTVRARALLGAGIILAYEGDFERSASLLEEALTLARQGADPAAIAQALTYLGGRATLAGEWDAGARLLLEALQSEEATEDRFLAGHAHFCLGTVAYQRGDYVSAEASYARAVAWYDAREDERNAGAIRLYLARAIIQRGDQARAVPLVRQGLHTASFRQDRWHLTLAADAVLAMLG